MSACWPHFLLLSNDVFPCSMDHGYWQFPGPYFNSLETSEGTVSLSHLLLKNFWGRTLESVRCPVFGVLTVIRDWGTKTGLTWAMCPPLLPEAGVLRVCWEVGLGWVEGGISIAEMWPFREELLENFFQTLQFTGKKLELRDNQRVFKVSWACPSWWNVLCWLERGLSSFGHWGNAVSQKNSEYFIKHPPALQ